MTYIDFLILLYAPVQARGLQLLEPGGEGGARTQDVLVQNRHINTFRCQLLFQVVQVLRLATMPSNIIL